MRKAGINGARNGRDTQNPDKYKHYSLNIRPVRREVIKNSLPRYKDYDNIVFDHRTCEEILFERDASNEYCKKLEKVVL